VPHLNTETSAFRLDAPFSSGHLTFVPMITNFSAFVNGYVSITGEFAIGKKLWKDSPGGFEAVRKRASIT
jgi:hypothetical protein